MFSNVYCPILIASTENTKSLGKLGLQRYLDCLIEKRQGTTVLNMSETVRCNVVVNEVRS